MAWWYCDSDEWQQQTVPNMMGGILKLLAGGEIPDDIRKAFLGKTRLSLPSLMRILRTTIASLPQVFICVDALDEFPGGYLPMLFASLNEILGEFPKTKIFLTGRPHVKEVVQRHFVGAVAISICPNPNDIRNYVRMRLDAHFWHLKLRFIDDLLGEIGEIMVEKMGDR